MNDIIKMEGEPSQIFHKVDKIPEWQSHFDKYCIKAGSFEIPRPFMVKGYMDNGRVVYCEKSRLPALAGGLCPYGDRYFEIGKVWVFVLGKTNEHYPINQKKIVYPDLEEYKRYFKKDVESMKYFIENKINKAINEEISCVAIRKK